MRLGDKGRQMAILDALLMTGDKERLTRWKARKKRRLNDPLLRHGLVERRRENGPLLRHGFFDEMRFLAAARNDEKVLLKHKGSAEAQPDKRREANAYVNGLIDVKIWRSEYVGAIILEDGKQTENYDRTHTTL